MKKTLYLISCVVASSLMAQGATLVSEWDGFTADGAATTGNLTFNFGASSVSDGVLNVKADGSLANRPTVDLSSAGLNLSAGLTISLEVKGGASRNGVNDNLIGLASADNQYLFAAGTNGSGNGSFLFNGSINNAGNTGNNTSLNVVSTESTAILTITAGLEGSRVVFKMYQDGELVASGSTTNTSMAQQTLTKLTLGGWAGNSTSNTTDENVSRLAIYDGAMTADEVQAAYMAWTAPEPATTTLSLLGLGSLLLHRRRQH